MLDGQSKQKLVTTQLDLYWVTKGNADPVEVINAYPRRIELVYAKTAGLRRIIVENEQWKGGLECAQISHKSLTKLIA